MPKNWVLALYPERAVENGNEKNGKPFWTYLVILGGLKGASCCSLNAFFNEESKTGLSTEVFSTNILHFLFVQLFLFSCHCIIYSDRSSKKQESRTFTKLLTKSANACYNNHKRLHYEVLTNVDYGCVLKIEADVPHLRYSSSKIGRTICISMNVILTSSTEIINNESNIFIQWTILI